jgi:hypothetical protein
LDIRFGAENTITPTGWKGRASRTEAHEIVFGEHRPVWLEHPLGTAVKLLRFQWWSLGAERRLDGAQIGCRGLSALGHNVERDFLSLVEAAHPGAFDSADVDEHVLAAVIWLDEAEALLAVEPLYGSLRHVSLLSSVYERSRFLGMTAGLGSSFG